MPPPPASDLGRCLTPAEIATLLSCEDADTPQGGAAHLNACDACQRRMQQWLLGGTRAVTGWPGPATPPDESAVPPEAAGFTFESVIGVGGMGAVWRAVQHLPSRTVAVKFVRGRQASEGALARLRGEANAAARLQHPNVVTLYEFREDPAAGAFLTLEYVPGGTLADRMAGGPLDPAGACRLVRTLAEAVGFAHSRGVVHRDLKPANVLLADDGTPKVADFGIARVQGSNTPGEVAGTPHYMAPEQARGDAVDARADVYALGVILFELVTGQTPFCGDTAAAVLLAAERSDPPRAGRLRKGVPKAVETICEKCLQRHPDRRYASAYDLAADLERFLTGRPVQAMPVSAVAQGWMWARRNKAVTAALALGAVLVFVGGPVVTYLWLTADRARGDAQTAEGKERVAKDYALAAVVAQPSEDDLDPNRNRVRLSGPELRPIEQTVEQLKALRTVLGDTDEATLTECLVRAVEGKRAAIVGDWLAADTAYQRLSTDLQKLNRSPALVGRTEALELAHAELLVEQTTIRRNLGVFERAEETARAALSSLDRSGSAGNASERDRVRRDALLEHLRCLRALGRHDEADRTAVQAERAAEQLAEKPGEPDDLSALGRCLVFLAQQPGPNAADAVGPAAKRALAVHLRVHESFPNALRPAFETGEAYLLVAEALRRSGQLEAAKRQSELGHGLLEKLAKAHPEYTEILHALTVGAITQVEIAMAEGRPAEAVRLARSAVERTEVWRRRQPGDVMAVGTSAEAYLALATAQTANMAPLAGDRSLATSIRLLTGLPEAVRRRSQPVLLLARCRLELAARQLADGRVAESQSLAREAVAELREWVATGSADDTSRRQILEVLDWAVLPTGRLSPDAAEEAVTLFASIAETLRRNDPAHEFTTFVTGHNRLLSAIVDVHRNRRESAIEGLTTAVKEFDRVKVSDGAPGRLSAALGRSYFFVARTYQRLGRRAEQVEAERKSIAHRRKWAEARPDDFDAADALAHSLAFLGDALAADGGPDDEAAFEEAFNLWDRFDKAAPAARLTASKRAQVLVGVAYRRIDQDRFPQAEESLKQAWELLDSIPEPERASAEFRTASRLHHNRTAWLRAKTGDYEACESAAKELAAAAKGHPNALLDAAFYLAWCRDLADRDQSVGMSDRANLVERYASGAVRLLEQAVDAGVKDLATVRSKPQFQRLADRDDFRAVLKRMESKPK